MFDLQAFRTAFPEFGEIPGATVLFWGAFAEKLWNKTAWGKWYTEAVYLYTAHRLALAYNITGGLQANNMRDPTTGTQIVTSRRADTSSLSVDAATNQLQTGDDVIALDLSRTTYGMLLLELIHLILPPARLICSQPIGVSASNWYNGKWWPI